MTKIFVVLAWNGGILGTFNTRKLAEDSIKYSFHKEKASFVFEKEQVCVLTKTGKEHHFHIREWEVSTEVIHL